MYVVAVFPHLQTIKCREREGERRGQNSHTFCSILRSSAVKAEFSYVLQFYILRSSGACREREGENSHTVCRLLIRKIGKVRTYVKQVCQKYSADANLGSTIAK
jgi:hypothetical protein